MIAKPSCNSQIVLTLLFGSATLVVSLETPLTAQQAAAAVVQQVGSLAIEQRQDRNPAMIHL